MNPSESGRTIDSGENLRGVATGLRRIRRTGRPSITAVVISRAERVELEARLRSLVPECEAAGAEIVVAWTGGVAEIESVRASWCISLSRRRAWITFELLLNVSIAPTIVPL